MMARIEKLEKTGDPKKLGKIAEMKAAAEKKYDESHTRGLLEREEEYDREKEKKAAAAAKPT